MAMNISQKLANEPISKSRENQHYTSSIQFEITW